MRNSLTQSENKIKREQNDNVYLKNYIVDFPLHFILLKGYETYPHSRVGWPPFIEIISGFPYKLLSCIRKTDHTNSHSLQVEENEKKYEYDNYVSNAPMTCFEGCLKTFCEVSDVEDGR